MSTEENKALVRRIFEEGLNQNHPSVLDELIAPDFVIYDAPPGMQHGLEGFRQVIAMFRTAFPDIHVTFEEPTNCATRLHMEAELCRSGNFSLPLSYK